MFSQPNTRVCAPELAAKIKACLHVSLLFLRDSSGVRNAVSDPTRVGQNHKFAGSCAVLTGGSKNDLTSGPNLFRFVIGADCGGRRVDNMRIAFVWSDAYLVMYAMPLPFGHLVNAIRGEGHTVKLFNLPLEGWRAESPEFRDAIADFAPDVIAATAWPISLQRTLAAVDAAHAVAPAATRILGGNYASLNPQQAWATGRFDYILTGEAEPTFAPFLRLLAVGDLDGLKRLPGLYFQLPDGTTVSNRNDFHDDLDALGAIDYDFLELDRCIDKGYMRSLLGPRRRAPLFATRGCRHRCYFCTASLMNGPRVRHYSVEHVVGQIRLLYEKHRIRMILFMDDNILEDPAFFKDLCRAVADLGLRDLVLDAYRGMRLEDLDEELLRLAKLANFKVISIAPESGSERVRGMMNKLMTTDQIVAAARMVSASGLLLRGFFILGYPGETPAERQQSYRMIRALDFDIVQLHRYSALPGTVTFKQLLRSGKVAPEHADLGFINGGALPDFNGDGKDIDREQFAVYVRLYLLRPWKLLHLFYFLNFGGIVRAFRGIVIGRLRAGLGGILPGPGVGPMPPSTDTGSRG